LDCDTLRHQSGPDRPLEQILCFRELTASGRGKVRDGQIRQAGASETVTKPLDAGHMASSSPPEFVVIALGHDALDDRSDLIE
jgi:hypothetical protein